MQYVLLLILIPVFWFLLVRPQQQRQRAHDALVAGLEVGDRIEGFSGIQGTLTAVDERTVEVEIADGVVVTMARMAVASVIEAEAAPDDEPDEADEGVEAE